MSERVDAENDPPNTSYQSIQNNSSLKHSFDRRAPSTCINLESNLHNKDEKPSRNEETLLNHHAIARHILDRQVYGCLHPWTTSHLHHTFIETSYQEHCLLNAHPWNTPLLGTHSTPIHPTACIQCAQIDATGELLVTGTEHGIVSVHHTNDLTTLARNAIHFKGEKEFDARPLLSLNSNIAKIENIKWNPVDENMIGVVGASSRNVHLYDIQHTQGRPTRILTIPSNAGGIGIGDLSFFGEHHSNNGASSGHCVAVGGPSGQVYVWDVRCAGVPSSTLQSMQPGSITSLHVLDYGRVVLAGTQRGDVKAWDVRGGSGGALRFAGVPNRHPLISCINIGHALADIPGLLQQAGSIPMCSIHSMHPDPCDTARLGFHLGCGWSGVLDVLSKEITHVHAPSQCTPEDLGIGSQQQQGHLVLMDEIVPRPSHGMATVAPTLRRRACWTSDGSRYIVPSRQREAVLMLDFSVSKYAGCSAMIIDDASIDDDSVDFKNLDQRDRRDPMEEDCDASYDTGGGGNHHPGNGNGRRRRGGGDDVIECDEDWDSSSAPEGKRRRRRIEARRVPSAAEVPLSHAAICTATFHGPGHSGTGEFVIACGAQSHISCICSI